MNSVIGIDEVGRGAWAGPLLVVAARQKSELSPLLKDSKLLSKVSRGSLVPGIKIACDIGEGWVMPYEIDRLGLTQAMHLGVARALEVIDAWKSERIIMDGNFNYCDKKYFNASAVVDADALFPIVSAASIFAKVTRDTYMSELPKRYAQYEFERHVGYGTARHQVLLKRHGVSDIHRLSFKPVKAMLQ
jgi:ribonuclease HII